jgi:DNA polymerase-3 subunit delta'
VPLSLIESALQHYGVEEERAELLARLSGGRIGWAIQAARDDSVLRHREDALRELTALPKMGRLDRLEYAQRLARSRDKIRETLGLWLGWWRDLLVIKGGSPDTIGNIDAAVSLEQDSRRYGLSEIVAFISAIRRTQRWLDMNVDSRLALEVLLLDLPVAES